MKRKTIVLLSSVLAGALLVGGTFAAYSVTDKADPFGINISPGTAQDHETHYVTLEWGANTVYEVSGISNLSIGEHRRAAVVGLKATPAHEGVFSAVLTDETEGKGAEEAALFDYIHVEMFEGVLTEYPEEPEIFREITPDTPAVAGVKKIEEVLGGDADGEDYTLFVSIDSSAHPVFEDMKEDQIHLEIDWSPKAGEEDTGNLVYYGNPLNWSHVYAYAFNEDNVGFNEWPGTEMKYDSTLQLHYLSIPLGYEKGIVFNDGQGGEVGEKQTSDISWVGYDEVTKPYWNGTAWAELPDAPTPAVVIPDNVIWGCEAGSDTFEVLGTLTANPEKPTEEMVCAELVLAAGQEFKIHLGEGEWYGYSALEDGTLENPNAKGNFAQNQQPGDSADNIIVSVPGTYSFYVKLGESKGLTWVIQNDDTPVVATYAATKNAEAVVLTDVKPSTDEENDAIFKLTLAVGDVVRFTRGDAILNFYHSEEQEQVNDGPEYTATKAGEHTFYVNKSYHIYTVQPSDTPQPEATYSATVNNEAIVLTDVKGSTSVNHAEYKITLAVGDTIVFKLGDDTLGFYHWDSTLQEDVKDGESFTATVAGEHSFYVNDVDHIYVTEALDPTNQVTINFAIPYDTGMGYSIFVTGSFADWAANTDYKLEWTDGNVWTGSFVFPVGTTFKVAVGPTAGGEVTRWTAGEDLVASENTTISEVIWQNN